MADDGVFRETMWLWICCNYCLLQPFPQSPDDQIRSEAALVLICEYHTLTGTRTTADGVRAGGEFFKKMCSSVKVKTGERKKPKAAEDVEASQERISATNPQTH